MNQSLDIVILGLAITSSWGNGHASTYRGLTKGLAANGHRVLFLERNMPWYADNRDEPNPLGCRTAIYSNFEDLTEKFERSIREADLVILGSYVPEGIRVGRWLVNAAGGYIAFYDIDTPVTLALLQHGSAEYIDADLIRQFHAYLSFTGGPTLRRIETEYGSPMARSLYCAVDGAVYRPEPVAKEWAVGYLGTYSEDRQPSLQELLLNPATRSPDSRFAVAGPQYPDDIVWPANVDRTSHLAPPQHPAFYGAQDFTLNITRDAMKQAGYSPSVRLFEAGACATPVISDWWPGLDSIFSIGSEILVAENAEDVLRFLRDISAVTRIEMGQRLRARTLKEHSPAARARQIELYFKEMSDHLPAGSTRRHRRAAKDFGWISTGMDTERGRPGTGSTPGGAIVELEAGCGIHKSLGTGSRNGDPVGGAPRLRTKRP